MSSAIDRITAAYGVREDLTPAVEKVCEHLLIA